MRKAFVSVVSLGIGLSCLVGCGGSSSSAWVKPGVTEEQRGRDTLECLTDSSVTVPGGPAGPRQAVDQDRYRRCMMDRGYTEGPSK